MKKFLYFAILALTMGVFASCVTGASSLRDEPEIDEQNATINGKHYDNETYKCWEFTWEYTVKVTGEPTESEDGVDYYWTTEFEIQKMKAEFDYTYNYKVSVMGVSSSATGKSSIKETDKSNSECYDYD